MGNLASCCVSPRCESNFPSLLPSRDIGGEDPVSNDRKGPFCTEMDASLMTAKHYNQTLQQRSAALWKEFKEAGLIREDVKLEVFASKHKNYRMRVGFGLYDPLNPSAYNETPMVYEYGGVMLRVEEFPIASEAICAAMPRVLRYIRADKDLREEVRSAKFLSSSNGQIVLTLVYRGRTLEGEWEKKASVMRDRFGYVGLIGRSKKVRKVIGVDYVIENGIKLNDGRTLKYKHVEGAFSNPNLSMCIGTLNWLCSVAEDIRKHIKERPLMLLELYCGCGNHTVALAGRFFDVVLGVDIDKKLVEAAQHNLAENKVTGAKVIRGDSQRFCRSILRRRKYVESEGDAKASKERDASFSAVLVDPPRVGLDDFTRTNICVYPSIIYVSCNPEALKRDLKEISKTHVIVRFAFLDHFPYTNHIEAAVYMLRKDVNLRKDRKI
ncbi:hypothetical protein AAMO2058_000041400 [Amorphochlora amoebiformis]